MPRSLDKLLRPRSIAVVGASSQRKSLGGMVTHRLFQAGFTGTIFPVNPRHPAIHSTKSYPSLAEIPDPVDLALVVVPRDAVLQAARDCVDKGVGAVAVITAGFKEASEEGARLEDELTEILRGAGIPFIGPNCMGLFNTSAELRLDATFSPTPPLPGPLSFASQSGALGVVVLNASRDRGIGFSQFVSVGNKADIDENDLLEAWEDDEEVPVVTTYLEGFVDAPGFLETARRVTRKKPVVLLKAGRTAAGAKAASSHTGALAAEDTGTEALCRQGGVLRAESVDEMLDVGLVLSRSPTPRGPRVAILTNAGGPGIMATDKVCDLGLEMAELAAETRAALSERLPPQASTGNPVDVLPSASPEDYAACVELLGGDAGVDAILSITVTPPLFSPVDTLSAIAPAAERTGKPVIAVLMVSGEVFSQLDEIENAPPVFRAPEAAANALAAAWRYARWRQRDPEEPAEPAMDHDGVAQALGAPGDDGYLAPDATFRLLEAAGLPVAPWAFVDEPEEASAAAERVGLPVALKASGPGLVHKSDVGGVALGLESVDEVAAAVDRMQGRLHGAGVDASRLSWLVQAMRPGGREVIVGASRDAQFGPLVMFGLGGKYVEVFRDVRFAMAKLTRGDAEDMVHGIRGRQLLTGTRGEKAVALGPAVETIERIAALLRHHESIAELDVNPLLLFEEAERAVLVDARIRVGKA